MALSCSCDYYSAPGDLLCYPDNDFTKLQTKRRRRCYSCNVLIDIDSYVLRAAIVKISETDLEEKIYGEEVPLADRYLCERCGEIYLNLTELGFYLWFGDDMREALWSYQNDYLVKRDMNGA